MKTQGWDEPECWTQDRQALAGVIAGNISDFHAFPPLFCPMAAGIGPDPVLSH